MTRLRRLWLCAFATGCSLGLDVDGLALQGAADGALSVVETAPPGDSGVTTLADAPAVLDVPAAVDSSAAVDVPVALDPGPPTPTIVLPNGGTLCDLSFVPPAVIGCPSPCPSAGWPLTVDVQGLPAGASVAWSFKLTREQFTVAPTTATTPRATVTVSFACGLLAGDPPSADLVAELTIAGKKQAAVLPLRFVKATTCPAPTCTTP